MIKKTEYAMNTKPFQAGLMGVFIVVLLNFIGRFSFLDGSLFDPITAPGVGPLALGDLLVIGAFAIGYFASYLKQRSRNL